MAEGVHGDDFLAVAPLWEGPDGGGGLRVGEVGFVGDVEVFGGDGKGVVDGVGAAVGADCCGEMSVTTTLLSCIAKPANHPTSNSAQFYAQSSFP